jgi:ribulose-phosphate 3-epimerase
MAIICPTVTATDAHDYRTQMERVEPFAKRLHIDFMDGELAPTSSPTFEQAWLPKDKQIDLHVMYKRPVAHLKEILRLKPRLVIVHAESSGNFVAFAKVLHKFDIKVGVALLPKTSAVTIRPAIEHVDHVLIFSGKLGHFGGTADLALLAKVQACKALKSSLEIGWDGGINENNAHLLAAGGVDILNVGGYIQRAKDPHVAYAKLERLVNG